jgi:hypothetical protein
VDAKTHFKISGYYHSKVPAISGDLLIRDWLAGQSFEEQYQFGLNVLKSFGVIT